MMTSTATLSKIRFGTDGWRAIIGQDYSYDNVSRLIQAYCDKLNHEGKTGLIILGYDRRFSSRLFAEAAASVLLGNGFQVLMSKDFCPTPCVSWMVKQHHALGGVVITASHNPFQWNGVKFKDERGASAAPIFCQDLETRVDAVSLENIQRTQLDWALAASQLEYFDPQGEYLQQLASFVDLDLIKSSGVKILVDSLYGAGAHIIKSLLPDLVDELRAEENPAFPDINPEPIALNLAASQDATKTHRYQLTLATDGDADRIGALDEHGNFVNAHQIYCLILRHLLRQKNKRGALVKTVSSTQMIDAIAAKYQLEVFETPIGFKHIAQKFAEHDILMGGEESGGIGIAEHVHERDGLLCGLVLAEIIATHRKPLSEIISDLQSEFGPFYYLREDLHLDARIMTQLKQKLTQDQGPLPSASIASKNTLDGFKYFLHEHQAWLLIRASGTEPLLRVYAESNSASFSKSLIDLTRKWIDQSASS